MKVLGAILGSIAALLGVMLLYFIYFVVSIGIVVGAVWLVLKIFGIDIEGFTA